MRQYVARPGQESKSELIIGAGLERVRWTAWYFPFWWLVQWNQGWHQGTNGVWGAFWKQAMSRQRKQTWVDSLFQTRDAVDEKDFEVAIDVFLNGADMVIEEEDRNDCEQCEGVYLERICVGVCVMCWNFEVFVKTCANEFWMCWSLLLVKCQSIVNYSNQVCWRQVNLQKLLLLKEG